MVFTSLLMAGIGFTLAQTIGPFITDYLPEDARVGKAPSFLSALFFAAIGKLVSTRLHDLHTARINRHYEERYHLAKEVYEEGKLEEHRVHDAKLRTLWREYVGEEYPDTGSHALVIAGDLATERRRRDHTVSANRSIFIELGVKAVQKLRRRKKPKLAPTTRPQQEGVQSN